jgi:hypothetical protein
MAEHYMKNRNAKREQELAPKNIMAALKRYEGSPTANKLHVDALHKMLALYLNGDI